MKYSVYYKGVWLFDTVFGCIEEYVFKAIKVLFQTQDIDPREVLITPKININ